MFVLLKIIEKCKKKRVTKYFFKKIVFCSINKYPCACYVRVSGKLIQEGGPGLRSFIQTSSVTPCYLDCSMNNKTSSLMEQLCFLTALTLNKTFADI